MEIHENGDCNVIAKDQSIDNKKMSRYCFDTFDFINDQQIDKFGLDQDFQIFWEAEKDLAVARSKHAISQDPYDRMMMEVAEAFLKSLGSNIETDFNKTISKMGKHFGYTVNPMTLPTVTYYTNIDIMNESASDNGRN